MCQPEYNVTFRLEGFTALYSGLTPGLQRQLVFSSLRIGLYERMRNGLFRRSGLSTTSTGAEALLLRVTAGLSSGSFAICVAQPMDVVKIRRVTETRGGSDWCVAGCRRQVAALSTAGWWTPTSASAGRRACTGGCTGGWGPTLAGMELSTPVRQSCTT